MFSVYPVHHENNGYGDDWYTFDVTDGTFSAECVEHSQAEWLCDLLNRVAPDGME